MRGGEEGGRREIISTCRIFNFSMGVNKGYTSTINQGEKYDFYFGLSSCL